MDGIFTYRANINHSRPSERETAPFNIFFSNAVTFNRWESDGPTWNQTETSQMEPNKTKASGNRWDCTKASEIWRKDLYANQTHIIGRNPPKSNRNVEVPFDIETTRQKAVGKPNTYASIQYQVNNSEIKTTCS